MEPALVVLERPYRRRFPLPSSSKIQQRYMGIALARKRAGKSRPSDPKMSEKELSEFASTKHKGLPFRKKALSQMGEKK